MVRLQAFNALSSKVVLANIILLVIKLGTARGEDDIVKPGGFCQYPGNVRCNADTVTKAEHPVLQCGSANVTAPQGKEGRNHPWLPPDDTNYNDKLKPLCKNLCHEFQASGPLVNEYQVYCVGADNKTNVTIDGRTK
ncbi:hypothetical protein P389DRAFT_210118 [Cystobasidium minutum MCA 4210]|uniref:uncharacterized protein n=1 Tax=Cystobasidium minutum MCA 4210 TaxID=1397322 RepID=UPI0034CDD485|eukprot:jgi/Rhomi1/210118/estExt_Genemark1.C_3_t20326